jgi:hypothetical protein
MKKQLFWIIVIILILSLTISATVNAQVADTTPPVLRDFSISPVLFDARCDGIVLCHSR